MQYELPVDHLVHVWLALAQPRLLGPQRVPVECRGWPGPLVIPHTLDTVEGVALAAEGGRALPRGQCVDTQARGDHPPTSEAVTQQPLLLLTGQRPGPVLGIFPRPGTALILIIAALID